MPFVNFKTCCTDLKQFIRLVVLLFCLCVSCYQLAMCFRKIQYPPISTHYGFFLNETVRYPSVTICRNPGFKIELFGKYGFTNAEITYATSWRTFNYANYTLEDFFNETTYTLEETILIAALNKRPSNLQITPFYSLNYGRCFTIKPTINSKKWGNNYGYFFYFAPIESNSNSLRILNQDLFSGYHIFIQEEAEVFTEKSQNADIFLEYLYLESGDSLQVNLRINKYHQLPGRTNNCNPSFNYSKSKCMETGLNELITKEIGCSTPWVPYPNLPQCSSYATVEKIIEHSTPRYGRYLEGYLAQLTCTLKCNTTTFTPFVQTIRSADSSSSSLKIYYPSNLYTLMEEVVGYDWNNFLADLGGSLGFLLGLSVLGIIALAEDLFSCFLKNKNKQSSQDPKGLDIKNPKN